MYIELLSATRVDVACPRQKLSHLWQRKLLSAGKAGEHLLPKYCTEVYSLVQVPQVTVSLSDRSS
jgi:hypothetical protein